MDSNIDSSHFTVDQYDQSNYNDLLIEQEEEAEEDEEKLLEALNLFELRAFEQKKHINSMDLICIQSTQLPNTLNLCYQNLQKNLNNFNDASEQIQNFGGQNLFQQINDFQKKAREATRTFGKLKSEYFMINEPIINKQISELNLNIIEYQNQELEQICQKFVEVQENIQNIKNSNNQLKQNFLTFQQNVFETYEQKLLKAQAEIDKSIEQIEETKINQLKELTNQKQNLSDFQKKQTDAGLDSHDQRANIDQYHKNLINQQKSLQKWNKEYEQNQPLLLKVQAQLKQCSQLFSKPAPCSLQQINDRASNFYQIADCLLDSNKLLSQLENTQKQLQSIQAEQQDLAQKENQLSQSLTQTISNESQEIFAKINQIRRQMEADLQEKQMRAQAAEEKVKEVEISQNDRLFIQKELARQAINIEQIANQLQVIEELAVLDDTTNFNNLKKLKKIINDQEKLKAGKVEQVSKGVESVEQFLLKSVKNKVNEENKTTQNKISKLKRGYDEFLKKYEQVMHVYNQGIEQINDFQEKYKINLNEIVEQLSDEFLNIFSKKEEDGKEILINKCLTYEKRHIIEQVNSLVTQFNEITQLLRDSQSTLLKSEDQLNQIVLKNQSIQTQTKNVEEEIEQAKKEADKIIVRLNQIINPDILNQLEKAQQEVSGLADECKKLKQRIESDLLRNEQALNKINDNVDESRSKLELFNPLSNKSIEAGEENQNILASISDLMDETNNYIDDLQNNQSELNDYRISIHQIDLQQVLLKINSSQCIEEAIKELESIHKQLKKFQEVVIQNENKRNDLGQDVNKLCKKVRDLVDGEISKNIKKAQSTIQDQETTNQTNQEAVKQIRFKIKYLLSEILDADNNFGQKDQQLSMKLEMATLKTKQIEDQIEEAEQIISKQKQRRNESIRTLEECKSSSLTKTSVINLENLLQGLKEQQEGNNQLAPQLQEIQDQIILKTKEIEELLEAYTARQDLQDKINQIDKEIEQEFQQLRPVLDKLPNLAFQLKRAVQEMLEGAQNSRVKEEKELTASIIEVLVQGGDYDEKKEELDEQLEELTEIQEEVQKHEDNLKVLNQDYKDLKSRRDHVEGDRLKKRLDDFTEIKNAVSNLLTDALDSNEQLEDLKRDIGDCDLPIVLTKRKNQISQFLNRFERAKKDNFYMKKAFKTKPENKPQNDKLKFNTQKQQEKLKSQMLQLETQLKDIESEKTEIETKFRRELEKIDSQEFDDYNKNFIIIKKLRDLKKLLTDNELKLKETEELQKEIMRKLSEQDLENSTDVLVARANGLKERLSDAKKHLSKIKQCGEQMDGNTSNREEEEFVQALSKEMPQVLINVDSNIKIINEVDGLAKEIKISLDTVQFENLKQKVQNSQDNAEECEALILKLEKDLYEWNVQKKLIKRDIEIEEIQNLFSEIQEELQQEKSYTETELERNRTKQNENRDQEMVDKDGNKVNIMEDLIRLRGQLQSYLVEVTEIENQLLKFEQIKEKIIEEFNQLMPDNILEERKKRNKLSQAAKMKQLKRPAQLLTKTKVDSKTTNKEMDLYKMLEINCQFRKPSKELISQLKQLHQARKELEDKFAAMRREVFKIKQIKLYKPVIGDVVDEMFAGYLNKANLAIEVQRISAKNYMFGTKKILANIVNDRLVIRVGGGFMNVEEFIEQYGKIEMLKLIKAEEKTKNEDESPGLNQTFNKSSTTLQQQAMKNLREAVLQSTPRRNGGPRQSIMITQNDIKTEMRKTLTARMGLPRQSVFGSTTSKGENSSLDNSFQGPSKGEVRNSTATLKSADLANALKSIPKKF